MSSEVASLRAGLARARAKRRFAVPSLALLACALSASANAMNAALASTESLKKLSIEELMDVEVTTVSRSVERLGSAAAAIAVVTNEDIRRSGATTIAETLRGVPGLHVARRNSNSWAIASRGFSSINSEKLLVLSDARSLYTPLVSGVAWDVQDYLLQDIDRIEVIRGPGAALWGSNAVNGVINIITKHSRDTQDLYMEAAAGDLDEVLAGVRYGGTLGDRGHFRVFAKYSERDGTYHPGRESDDNWDLAQVGVRGDFDLSARDALMVQAATYDGEVGQLAPAITVIGRPGPTGQLTSSLRGGHVLGRWVRTIDEHSLWRVRLYYDRTRRDDPSFLDELDTIDFDVQNGFALFDRHSILWGLNYRYTDHRNVGAGLFNLEPGTSRDRVISGFVQDQIALADGLRLTVGTKLEDNDFSGFEVQPSVRLAWDVTPAHMVWGSISRAARIPTRVERDIAVEVTPPGSDPQALLLGSREFDSEELIAYEAGYRWHASSRLSVDIATYYNRYDGLVSLEFGDPYLGSDGRTVLPIENTNLTDGTAHGIEALVTYAPRENWRLSAIYSFTKLSLDPRGMDVNRGEFYEGATPRHQAGLRSLLDLPRGVQFDLHFYYVDELERLPDIDTGEGIDAYTKLDVRLGWQATEQLELSIVGQNLLDNRHIEFGTPEARGEIERNVYAKVTWGF
jgi:iron complex outermembrane receptor protein